MRALALGAVCLLVLAACQDQPPTSPLPGPPLASISDGSQLDGNPHFFWLPPLVKQPTTSGVPNPGLSPVLQICHGVQANGECVGSPVATYTTTSGPGGEVIHVDAAQHYQVKVHTDVINLVAGETYRWRVLVASTELGHADIKMEATGQAAKNVTDDEFIGLVDGRTLPTNFRIEEGALVAALCTPDQQCGEGVVSPEAGGLVTVQPSPGVDVAGAEIPAGAVDQGTAIVIREVDCSNLPTGRKQAPPCFEFIADPPIDEFNATDFPVIVAMCVDVGALTPAEQERIALYKFDEGDPNVRELAHAPENFLDCEAVAIAAANSHPLFRLARSGWRFVQRHVSPWFSPRPAMAIDLGLGGTIGPGDGGFSMIGWAVERVLVYGPSLGTETTFRPLNEQSAAEEFGITVDVADGETWSSKSLTGINGFGDYDAIVFGEVGSSSQLDAAGTAWSASVTGPAVISALHAWLHQCEEGQEAVNILGTPGTGFHCLAGPPQAGGLISRPQAKTFLRNAIQWVTSGTRTGLYVGLGTRYAGAAPGTTLGFLNSIGSFRVIGIGDGPRNPAEDVVSVAAPSHAVMSGLSDAGLSGWFASVHEFFHPLIELAAFPADFGTVATSVRYTWLRDGSGNLILDEGGNPQIDTAETLPAIIVRPNPAPPSPVP